MTYGRQVTLALLVSVPLVAAGPALGSETPSDSLPARRATCPDFRSGESFTIGAQHLLQDGTVAPTWDPSTTPLCLGAALEIASISIPDGSGGALVVWVDTRSGESDIYAQHLTGSGAVAQGWPADGVGVCLAPGFQDRVAMASDGAGGFVVAWQDYRAGSNGAIYAQRVLSSGEVAWQADGVAVSAGESDEAAPDVVSDGSGGAFVVWQDDRTGDYDLRWARVDANGAIAPSAGGASLVQSPSDQRAVRLVTSGVAHVTAVWQDADAAVTRLRAARFAIDAPQALSGASVGVTLTSNTGASTTTAIASDGGDGAFVSWSSHSGSSRDIMLQRVSAQGEAAFGDTGIVVCDEPHDQYAPALTADGSGGCIVAWEDFRSGTADLYAQRVSVAGISSWRANGTPLCTATGEQYGVSLRGDGSGGMFSTWTDDVLPARANFLRARPTLAGTLPRLVSIETGPGRAHVVWQGSETDPTSYQIQRRTDAEEWRSLTESRLGAKGRLEHEDRGLLPGAHAVYRLAVQKQGALVTLEETPIDIPLPMPLALRFVRTEDRGRTVRIQYVLETHDRASLEVLDIAGRRVMERDLGAPGAGEHELRFASGPLPAGIYFVRLHQSRRIRTARLTLIR